MKSADNERDTSSGDDAGTSSNIRSDDENTFDLETTNEPEPAELIPIGNNRNFGSLSNDDP